jgi:HEAT repeat protein
MHSRTLKLDETTRTHLANLRSQDRALQNAAFTHILAATDRPVDWAYEAWDGLVADLGHRDNHVRAIAAQVLCNLAARSDPENLIYLRALGGLGGDMFS